MGTPSSNASRSSVYTLWPKTNLPCRLLRRRHEGFGKIGVCCYSFDIFIILKENPSRLWLLNLKKRISSSRYDPFLPHFPTVHDLMVLQRIPLHLTSWHPPINAVFGLNDQFTCLHSSKCKHQWEEQLLFFYSKLTQNKNRMNNPIRHHIIETIWWQ